MLQEAQRKLLSRRVIDPLTGCWNYDGATAHGYGSVRVEGKSRGAHRLAAAIWIGPKPTGSIVCHRCDNRLCFNPDHLYYGSYKQNSRDMMERRRGRSQFSSDRCRGSNHAMAKLAEPDVRAIRERISSGEVLTRIAESYGVTIQQISRIKRGVVWGWLQ